DLSDSRDGLTGESVCMLTCGYGGGVIAGRSRPPQIRWSSRRAADGPDMRVRAAPPYARSWSRDCAIDRARLAGPAHRPTRHGHRARAELEIRDEPRPDPRGPGDRSVPDRATAAQSGYRVDGRRPS